MKPALEFKQRVMELVQQNSGAPGRLRPAGNFQHDNHVYLRMGGRTRAIVITDIECTRYNTNTTLSHFRGRDFDSHGSLLLLIAHQPITQIA